MERIILFSNNDNIIIPQNDTKKDRSDYTKKYYYDNHERIMEYRKYIKEQKGGEQKGVVSYKKDDANNRERILEYHKNWYQNNKQRVKEYNKAWYQNKKKKNE